MLFAKYFSIQKPIQNLFQLRYNERVIIDPTKLEENASEESDTSDQMDTGNNESSQSVGQITIGYQPSLEQIALMSQEGNVKTDHLIEDTKKLTKVCSDLVTNVQMCLVESIKSSAAASKESLIESEQMSENSGIK